MKISDLLTQEEMNNAERLMGVAFDRENIDNALIKRYRELTVSEYAILRLVEELHDIRYELSEISSNIDNLA